MLLVGLVLGLSLGWDHWAVLYDTPIAWPFASFLLDRARDRRQLAPDLVDASVITAALTRALVSVPLYSGHALFLTYAAAMATTRTTRIAALIVLAQVAVTKITYLRDPMTLAGGIALAALVATLRARYAPVRPTGAPETAADLPRS